MQKWQKENPEKVRTTVRKWQKENPEKARASVNRRRARKKNAEGTASAEQIKARHDYHGNQCVYCGCSETLHTDHWIALARGGTNWPANLVPACQTCNSSKGTMSGKEFMEKKS